jgi:hypothetical protein
MADTAADILIDTLFDWGVDVVFGLPGDGINGIMEALRRRQDRIRFIQVRHEESAAFMACGYAKYTGRLGVCLATSGPGGIHLLNGLYDAKLDGQPVLAITGHHYHDLIGTFAQQDVDLDRVFADVALYSERIMGPAHVENVAAMACRTALAYRGVAHINFPVDTQSEKAGPRSERNVPHHNVALLGRRGGLPAEDDLQMAAELLNRGRKVALLVGRGALGAGDELEQVAERLGAPIIKALLGKAAVPDSSPYSAGGIGLLGTRPAQEALEACDTLLMVGTSFPYIEYLPEPGQARGIQIDIDPARIGLRYRVEVPRGALCCGRPLYDFGMLGRARRLLRRVLAALRPRIAAGVPLVVLEPSCAAVFRDEMLGLPDDEEARRLAGQTFTLGEFLQRRAGDLRLPELRQQAVVHEHCHHRMVLGTDGERQLLSRLGLEWRALDSGCCGMAGAFGFERAHYEVSVQVGERVLLPAVRGARPDTIIIADGFSCRQQIAQHTERRALHLAQVLQMALRQGRRAPLETAWEADPPERGYVRRHGPRWRPSGWLMGALAAGCALAVVAALGRLWRRRC